MSKPPENWKAARRRRSSRTDSKPGDVPPSAAPASDVTKEWNAKVNEAKKGEDGRPEDEAKRAPQFGRRAGVADGAGSPSKDRRKSSINVGGKESSNWFSAQTERPKDTVLSQAVPTVMDDADQEQARLEQAERAKKQKEQLEQHISDPPAGYQAVLPRLSELDVTNSWDQLLRSMRNEFDMSCLTACLARKLDDDIMWNPDMLLVQLTSDLLDAAELQNDGEAFMPVDARDIGFMKGGEEVRRRRERKVSVAPESGESPPKKSATNSNANTPRRASQTKRRESIGKPETSAKPEPAAKGDATPKRKESRPGSSRRRPSQSPGQSGKVSRRQSRDAPRGSKDSTKAER